MKHLVTAGLILALAACSPRKDEQASADATAPQAIAPVTTVAPPGDYTLDKSHASLFFRVNHLGFSHYTARFSQFDAKLLFDPAHPTDMRVDATIDANSLGLENPPPGFLGTLRGPEWLDTATYPQIAFSTTSVTLTGPSSARITGDLTLHGTTKPVTLRANFNGGYAGHPMDPHARVGFSALGTFKRSEFGVAYGIPAPGTTMGVSDEVEVFIEAEFSGPPLPAEAPKPN